MRHTVSFSGQVSGSFKPKILELLPDGRFVKINVIQDLFRLTAPQGCHSHSVMLWHLSDWDRRLRSQQIQCQIPDGRRTCYCQQPVEGDPQESTPVTRLLQCPKTRSLLCCCPVRLTCRAECKVKCSVLLLLPCRDVGSRYRLVTHEQIHTELHIQQQGRKIKTNNPRERWSDAHETGMP